VFGAILFDLDGVVADTHHLHRRAWRRLLSEVSPSVTVSDSELEFVREGCKRADILRHFLGPLSEQEIVRYGRRKDDLFMQESASNGLRPIAGAIELLAELETSDVRKALATSASRNRTHHVLHELGLKTRFCAVVTAEDVAAGKPDPEVFCLAAQRAHVRPETCLVIEDSCAGVRAAKAANMACVGIGTDALAQTLIQHGADYVLPDLTALSLARLRALFGKSHDPDALKPNSVPSRSA
jgi:HAD superfamily hydrolase (TIGR01509 family)